MLRFAHPELTDEQRAQVLQLTALDSGYPLDISGEYGGWQRMNLQAALTAEVTVDEAGNVVLGSSETDSEAGTEADTEPETGAESGSDGDTGSGAGADGQTEAGAEADDESGISGSAQLTVTEAAGAGSGTAAESGAGADEGQAAGADAAVASDQGSTQGALASTGFGVAGIAVLGLALLVVGGVLLRRSRREA
ncbi:LPXTG cell wall anchor domain-containing protein [Nesterenkonia lacusekhoensis]|uniref:LPXTG-motif cell wall-anchored protein n=1 Tax=Nesterenkonia lacusekhoensis TaxID=150832 RepID=A0ABS4T158_9MICC|nr:LPXTG cell wall anchor domain-containing protein [Nesterenkonia lacusekhoensis]MBP2317754.1 LPXTG-motif cell wall-anchored protein [Nesterenkonia lacusekhoensis]